VDVVGGEWVRWFEGLTCDFWAENGERKFLVEITAMESVFFLGKYPLKD
jgi:hypothetical protein